MIGTVLVLDGRSRAALSVIRSLGRNGARVYVGEAFRSASFLSKYVDKSVLYPRPDEEPEKFLTFLVSFLQRERVDLLIPVRDHTTEIVSRESGALQGLVKFAVPKIESFRRARDKSETILLARQLGIPHPKTLLPFELGSGASRVRDQLDFPVILKPCIGSGSRGIRIIKSWTQLESLLQSSVSGSVPFMCQEFIPHGGGFGVSVLAKEGQIKASFTHKRIREFPASGGPSTLREGISYPRIENYAFDLLRNLEWTGPAMVEFRVDKRDNTPKLMEINPRFWGSLQTSVLSGVDFPYLLFEMAMKGDITPQAAYELGRRVRWLLFGDILWFLTSPNKMRNLPTFLNFRGDFGYDVIDRMDLGPVAGLFMETFSSLFQPRKLAHIFKRGW